MYPIHSTQQSHGVIEVKATHIIKSSSSFRHICKAVVVHDNRN